MTNTHNERYLWTISDERIPRTLRGHIESSKINRSFAARSILTLGQSAKSKAIQSELTRICGRNIRFYHSELSLVRNQSQKLFQCNESKLNSPIASLDIKAVDLVIILLPTLSIEELDPGLWLTILNDACKISKQIVVVSNYPSVENDQEIHERGLTRSLKEMDTQYLAETIHGSILCANWEYSGYKMKLLRLENDENGQLLINPSALHSLIARLIVQELQEGQDIESFYNLAQISNVGNNDIDQMFSALMKSRTLRSFKPIPLIDENDSLDLDADSNTFTLPVSSTAFAEGKACIITGGTGTLGLHSALVMISLGASSIILVSRSGDIAEEDKSLFCKVELEMRKIGGSVRIIRCDISNPESVSQLFSEISTSDISKESSIACLIHSAGVLRDGLLCSGKASSGADEVWSAKVSSATFLLNHLRKYSSFRAFVSFSSITALAGNVGQSSYALANRAMEAVLTSAHQSNNSKECMLNPKLISIRWPGIIGAGMGRTIDPSLKNRMISTHSFRKLLFAVLTNVPQLANASTISVLPQSILNLLQGTLLKTSFEGLTIQREAEEREKLRNERVIDEAKVEVENMTENDLDSISSSISDDSILTSVIDLCNSSLFSNAIAVSDSSLPASLDSLSASQFANEISNKFNIDAPPTLIYSYPRPSDIAAYVRSQLTSQKISTSIAVEESHPKDTSVAPPTMPELPLIAIIGASVTLPGGIDSLPELWCALNTKEGSGQSLKSCEKFRSELTAIAEKEFAISEWVKTASLGHFLSESQRRSLSNLDALRLSKSDTRGAHFLHLAALNEIVKALKDANLSNDRGYCKVRDIGIFLAVPGRVDGGQMNSLSSNPISPWSVTGDSLSAAAGRISFLLDLTGPCMAIDTACSSSLVALHAARRSLQLGECSVAVVCTVNLLEASTSLQCAVAGMLAPGGRCRTFDASAEGYSRGEGSCAVVLRRDSDCEEAYCVIKGSAVAQDGRCAALTSPNGRAQVNVIRAALRDSRIEPDCVNFIEAHGSGTPLGDPVEVEALAEVFGSKNIDAAISNYPLYIVGSKATVGHLEAGAGLVGLCSAILSLQNRQVPPNTALVKLNPLVDRAIKGTRLVIGNKSFPLMPGKDDPIVCGVSAFGYAGTIAHVVLQGPPPDKNRTFSLDSLESSDRSCDDFAGETKTKVSRSSAMAGLSAAERYFNSLGDFCPSQVSEPEPKPKPEPEPSSFGQEIIYKVGFMFPGQGAQTLGMAASLCQSLPAAKVLFDKASKILGYDLLLRCTTGPKSILDSTAVSQPAIFVSSMAALEKLKQDDPVAYSSCSVAMGLSLGEYSALCFAGAFSFEEGVRLTKARGEAMQAASDMAKSGMVAIVGVSSEVVQRLCDRAAVVSGKPISIANYLGEGNYTISGAIEACSAARDLGPSFGARFALQLPVAGAFHTSFMQPAVSRLKSTLAELKITRPRIPVISNFDSKAHFEAEDIRSVLIQQMTSPVQWETTMSNMIGSPEFTKAYEIGPGTVCKGILKRLNPSLEVVSISV